MLLLLLTTVDGKRSAVVLRNFSFDMRHAVRTTRFRITVVPVFVPSARRAQGTMLLCTRVCP